MKKVSHKTVFFEQIPLKKVENSKKRKKFRNSKIDTTKYKENKPHVVKFIPFKF